MNLSKEKLNCSFLESTTIVFKNEMKIEECAYWSILCKRLLEPKDRLCCFKQKQKSKTLLKHASNLSNYKTGMTYKPEMCLVKECIPLVNDL